MNVYVESNFVLEHALQQEECESCADIIRLATSGRVKLVIPAFSLAEPHHALLTKAKARSRLAEDLRGQLGELGRSRGYREIPINYGALVPALIASIEIERENLRRAVTELIKISEVIPLDARVLQAAAEIEMTYRLSGQDAIVLASVLIHLESPGSTESCFLNRNSKDFDDPGIREKLEARQCKFFPKFAPALGYVVARGGLPSGHS